MNVNWKKGVLSTMLLATLTTTAAVQVKATNEQALQPAADVTLINASEHEEAVDVLADDVAVPVMPTLPVIDLQHVETVPPQLEEPVLQPEISIPLLDAVIPDVLLDVEPQQISIPLIETNATYSNTLTAENQKHMYSFSVTNKVKVTWQYKHVNNALWQHTLYDETQHVIGTKDINSASIGLFTAYEKILEPGTYYMEVSGNETALNEAYSFTITEVVPKMFEDVAMDHPYYDEIRAIQQMGIITGFENNTFEPDTYIQRKHIAAMIMRAEADVRLLSSPPNFADITYGHPYYQDIMGLYRSNIIDGKIINGEAYFEPDAPITRAQLAKILVNAFTISTANGDTYFTDVVEGQWYYDAANILAANGMLFDETGVFEADALVTRAQFAHLLYSAMHLD